MHLTIEYQNILGKKKKKIELKGEIYKSTIIIGDFKTSLSVIYQ